MKPQPASETLTRLGFLVGASTARALPEGFVRMREDTTVFLATEPVAADDDLVLMGPWRLERYRANPVILWIHNRDEQQAPIGRAIQTVETSPGTVYAEVEWDLEDPMGAMCARKYAQGFMSACSIRWRTGRYLHASQLPEGAPGRERDVWYAYDNELIEVSAVPIGALGSALAQRSSGELLAELHTLLRASPEHRRAVEALLLSQPDTPDRQDALAGFFAPGQPDRGLDHLFTPPGA